MAEDTSVKAWKASKFVSTQKFLPFWEIRDDHLILVNGWIRAILRTSSINFNLKSENEQKWLLSAYQGFLNTLSFPIQIIVRSKKLDIDNYIQSIEELKKTALNTLVKDQISEYGFYIKKLVEYANIMEKQFYIVVPIDWIVSEKRGFLDFFSDLFASWDESASRIRSRLTDFESQKAKIKPRVDTIVSSLAALWLTVNQLTTTEIIDLLYQSYNPDVSKNEKIRFILENKQKKE